jgi:hypothetical protein
MFSADPDTANISWSMSLQAANEGIERSLQCKLWRGEHSTPAKLVNLLQVFSKVFTVQKLKLTEPLSNRVGFITVLEFNS